MNIAEALKKVEEIAKALERIADSLGELERIEKRRPWYNGKKE